MMKTSRMQHVCLMAMVLVLIASFLMPAASVQARPATPVGTYDTPLLYDDFENPAFDGIYNPTLWSFSGDSNYSVRQTGGALTFNSPQANASGDGVLQITKPGQRTPAEMGSFQAKLKLSGVTGAWTTAKIQIVGQLNGQTWWTQCHLGASGGSADALFACLFFIDDGGSVAQYFSDQTHVSFDTWVTARIQIDPVSGQLAYYLNDAPVGSYTPVAAQALIHSTALSPRVGVFTSAPGSTGSGSFDGVWISGGDGASDEPKSLHISMGWPTNTDPAQVNTTADFQYQSMLFRGLTKIDPQSGATIPDLASGWSWNAGGDQVTFTLRPGLLWSDGTPLTAQDARFALLRSLQQNGPYAAILDPILGAADYRNKKTTDPSLVGVYADSDSTLRIQLTGVNVLFPQVLTLPHTYPMPQHLVSAFPDTWMKAGVLVSSGPYLLRDWGGSPVEKIRLTANPFYYGTPPAIQQIFVSLSNDPAWNWNQYLLGNLDTTGISTAESQAIHADPVISQQLHTYSSNCTFMVFFNQSKAPFGNLNVRKAFIAAIDRDQFIKNVLGGAAYPMQVMTPPGVFGAVDGVAKNIGIPFNADQARQYLSSAGYPGGANFPAITVQVQDSAAMRARWGELTSQWKSVLGVTITVEYRASLDGITPPMRFSGWCGDYNDAYNFVKDGIEFYKSIGYLGTWSDPAFTTLAGQMAQTLDASARLPMYEAAEQLITTTDALMAPIYTNINGMLTRPYINRTFMLNGVEPWETWTITRANETTYTPGAQAQYEPPVDDVLYSLPADLTPQDATIVHTVLPPEELSQPPSGLASIGRAFQLQVLLIPLAPAHAPALGAAPVITIAISYSPKELLPGHIRDESTLALYANINGEWVQQPSQVDTTNHVLTATTNQVNTEFIVWGTGPLKVFMPVVKH